MSEEKTTKKLSPAERKNMQRNADAVRREIERTKRRMELIEELNKIKFDPALYQFAPEFKANMLYQLDPRVIEISRKLDELNADSEMGKLQGVIDDCQSRLDHYLELLKERA